MLPVADSFTHEYHGCTIEYGRGSVSNLDEYLADFGLENALIVCGSNVGSNTDLMEPITAGLGDRYSEIFDGTTPNKQAEVAFSVIDRFEAVGADCLVGIGGGSSLDIARQASVFSSDSRSLSDLREEAHKTGTIRPPETGTDRPSVIVIPTTFAGADISPGGSLEVMDADSSPTGQPVTVSGTAMPILDVVDPIAFETTPESVLAGSAMNGFNKGVETLYARDSNPVSDATAMHGLSLLYDAFSEAIFHNNGDAMDRAVIGSILVQLYRKISIMHAFGHGFARRYPVQQGAVHAIIAPYVLEYLFERIDAKRDLLASALNIESDEMEADAVGNAIISSIRTFRNTLGVAQSLRELSAVEKSDLKAIATFIIEDPPMERVPPGLKPTVTEIENVLNSAW